MTTCFTATPGVDVITTTADIPALGSIAINADPSVYSTTGGGQPSHRTLPLRIPEQPA